MTTLTIELPDTLWQQTQQVGLSPQKLEHLIIQFVQLSVQKWPQQPKLEGRRFAQQLIQQNRALFEELAQL